MVSMCWFLVKYRFKALILLQLILNLVEVDGDSSSSLLIRKTKGTHLHLDIITIPIMTPDSNYKYFYLDQYSVSCHFKYCQATDKWRDGAI